MEKEPASEDEDEDEEEPDAPEPDEPEEPDVPESDGSDGPDKKEDSDKEAQIFIIAGVLLCVGAALLFLAWKRRKRQSLVRQDRIRQIPFR